MCNADIAQSYNYVIFRLGADLVIEKCPHLEWAKFNLFWKSPFSDHKKLARELLTDEVHFKRILRDPTDTFQQKANKLITTLTKRIQDDSGIDTVHKESMTTSCY